MGRVKRKIKATYAENHHVIDAIFSGNATKNVDKDVQSTQTTKAKPRSTKHQTSYFIDRGWLTETDISISNFNKYWIVTQTSLI